MKTAVLRGRGKLRPRRFPQAKPSETRRKNYLPYAILAALAALLAIPTSLGMISGPSLAVVSQTETPAKPLSASQPQAFSCIPGSKPSADFRGISGSKLYTGFRGFAFDTNSTVDSFSIDRNAKLITVGVNGADGSQGVFCINVPKSFIPTQQLKTTIDSIPLNADVREFSGSNVVTLKYHHSERVIQISGK